MLLAENPEDPKATYDTILREIVAWVKGNATHNLSPEQIESRARQEYEQHLLSVQENRKTRGSGMFKAGVIVSRSRELKSSLPTRAQGKLLVASGQIRGLAPTTLDKTYLASQLIQATLDHANPKVIRPCG